tara:strand:- start:274 stop:1632 length:1359 start_codon:yes stop_codon:yes gene_type:complete
MIDKIYSYYRLIFKLTEIDVAELKYHLYNMPWLCRDCFRTGSSFGDTGRYCPFCNSNRIIIHEELETLSIAHIDCDAFYSTVEKRDRTDLKSKPVLVGGNNSRSVVMAASYEARKYGCRAAMPMYKAKQLCPDAIIIGPNMEKYTRASKSVRNLMLSITPLVEPVSIDEAFLDLSGTEKLHSSSSARTLAKLVDRIEKEVGITVTVGLSYNKFLSKIASDINKPRGFSMIGKSETKTFLERLPISKISGVGKKLQKKLNDDGFICIGDLRPYSKDYLVQRYGTIGSRLLNFSRGKDNRGVNPKRKNKSISSETTFSKNISSPNELVKKLWPLAETVANRAKKSNLAARVVTLKLKTKNFKIVTRQQTLGSPTKLAEVIWETGSQLIRKESKGLEYRLIGIGISDFSSGMYADPVDLLNPDRQRKKAIEETIDRVRERFGSNVIKKGRGLNIT